MMTNDDGKRVYKSRISHAESSHDFSEFFSFFSQTDFLSFCSNSFSFKFLAANGDKLRHVLLGTVPRYCSRLETTVAQ